MSPSWTAIIASLVVASGIALGINGHQRTPHVIGFSPGGVVHDFIEDYDNLRRSGRPVVLDGICMSACTLVAGLVPLERICTTPYGKLGFHSAYRLSMFGPIHSSEGTRLLWQIYPDPLRAILRSRGWDGGSKENEHSDLIYVDGPDLQTIFRAC